MNYELKTSVLSYREGRTYVLSALFVLGNVLLPQLCHIIPGGGLMWLPIYFFTLIAAYRYGVTAGVLTAILSPVVNNLIFGMPPTPMLPVILTKSILLALSAAFIARRLNRVTFIGVALTVLAYQTLSSLAEWGMTGSLNAALQDLRMGWPGILTQVFGGCAVLALLSERNGAE